jgi:hypothetical protein
LLLNAPAGRVLSIAEREARYGVKRKGAAPADRFSDERRDMESASEIPKLDRTVGASYLRRPDGKGAPVGSVDAAFYRLGVSFVP